MSDVLQPEAQAPAKVPFSINDIEANPAFAKMSLQEQNATRSRYFQTYIASNPEFDALDLENQMTVLQHITDRAPVLAQPDDPTVLARKAAIAQAASGDALSRQGLKNTLLLHAAAKDSLVANVMAAGVGVVKKLSGEEGDYIVSAEGQKLDALTLHDLSRMPGETPESMAAFDARMRTVQTIAGLADDLLTMWGPTALLKGAKVGKAIIAGTERLASGMKAGFAQRLVSGLGVATIEGTAQAATTALKTVTLSALQSNEGLSDFTSVASRFGQDLATNYVIWTGFHALSTSAKVVKLLLRGTGKVATGAQAAQTAARSSSDMLASLADTLVTSGKLDPAIMAQLPEEARASVQRSVEALRTARVAAKLQTPEDVGHVIAQGAGYSIRRDGEKFVVSSLEDGIDREITKTFDDAVDYAARNSNIPNAAPGPGIAGPSVRYGFVDEAVVKKTDDPRTLSRLFEDTTEHAADSREYVARNLFEASGADMKDLKFKRIKNDDLFVTENKGEFGVKGEAALRSDEFKSGFAVLAKNGEVLIPTGPFKNAGQEAIYLDSLRQAVLARGGTAKLGEEVAGLLRPGTRGSLTGMTRTSNTALSSIVKLRWGAEARVITDEAGNIAVTVPQAGAVGPFGQADRAVVMSAPGENSFRMQLLDELQKSQALSTDQVAWTVEQSTGLKLKESTKVINGQTVSQWTLTTPNGKSLATYSSLSDVLKQDTLFGRMIKMPEAFAPKAYVADYSNNVLKFEGAIAEGPLIDVFDLRNEFDKAFTGPVGEQNRIPLPGQPAGAEARYVTGTRTFVLTPYEGAAPREFRTMKDMLTYEARLDTSLQGFKTDARVRGQEFIVGRDGSATLYDGTNAVRLESRASVKKYFKDHPVPPDAPEILPDAIDPAYAKELEAAIAEQSAKFEQGPAKRSWLRHITDAVVRNETAMRILGVSEATLAETARRTGSRQMLESFQQFKTFQRLTNAENRKYVAFVDEIWGGLKVDKREALATLLSVDKQNWKATAKKLYDMDLEPDDLMRLDKTTTFLNTFLRANGFDGLDAIYARKADIQAAVQAAMNTGKDLPADAVTLVKETLGSQAPKSLSLFSEGLTRTDLLNFFEESDPAMAMLAVIDKVHRQRFFGAYRDQFAKTLIESQKLYREGKISRAALSFFEHTMDESQGIKTSLALALSEKSHRVSYALASVANKSKLLRNLGVGDEIKTDDILGKLGQMFTFNSQAFRIWAVPRNLTQVYLVGAVTGNNKMWKALQYVLDNPKYVDKLYASGAMQESILAMGEEALTPLKKFQRIGLAPLEVSDGITRATAIRAAEMSIEEALPRRLKGLSTDKQFLRECNADFLAEADQLKFQELLTTNKDAAVDFLGQRMQTATMGDYSRGALGYAARGVVGRLFGKMGVYPLFTMELYRKLIASGDAVTRIARAARLAATSYALYYAFNAAGASYDGFLWSDPFSFSGGPYWTIMNNAMNAIGDRPENSLARQSLKRQAVSALVPGAMLAPYAKRAVEAAANGDALGVLRAVGTMPMSEEERLRRQ